jgi:hypothetical protein
MFRTCLRTASGIALTVAAASVALLSPIDAQRDPTFKVFVGGRVIDGTGKPPIPNAVVVVRGGRIEALGPAARVKAPVDAEHINVAGRTIVPGLVNAHGHVGETRGLTQNAANYTEENVLRQLGLYARYGITTVVSLGGDREAGIRLPDTQETADLSCRGFRRRSCLAPNTPDEARTMVRDVAAQKWTS